ncbi:MAG: hypothetical protein IVW52_05025 [Acidimicrobiales bacterium]|nr:hypothetical protein [Acidimicrobiales bacterium]
MRREPLHGITDAAARREGCRSVEDFMDQWQLLHGEWDPFLEVTVVRFEVVR